MSVNFDELAAHLDRQRREETKKQYEERSTNSTAAFLLCFFLGYLGAHRFYLGQWRSGVAHLVIFLLGVAGVISGFFTTSPLNAALWVIGGVLILASLIWEIIDLGRIDEEIHKRNLLLAEGIIAGALLSDHTVVDHTAQKLDEEVQAAAAQSSAASYDPSATLPGMISAEDLAQAKALAEESGRAAISYQEDSTFTVSATPEEQKGETTPPEPVALGASEITTEEPTSAGETPTVVAATTTHTEENYHVTDTEETDRVSGPSAAEAFGLGAAALGAAGLGAAAYEAAHEEPAPAPEPEPAPVAAVASEPIAEPTPEPVAEQAADVAPAAAVLGTTALAASAPASEPIALSSVDVTDAAAPEAVDPTSDVAFASSRPTYVTLPLPAVKIEPLTVATPTDEPAVAPVTAPEPATDAYVPPVPEVSSYDEPTAPYTPSWDAATAPAPQPEETAPAAEPNASHGWAEAAGLGAVAGAGALAAAAFAHHESEAAPADTAPAEPVAAAPSVAEAAPAELAPEAPSVAPEVAAGAAGLAGAGLAEAAAEPEAPKMKRIRVKHRIVVEGQVVREEIVEREVPADADLAEAARQIQAELEAANNATPDEIARLANLNNDEDVEVRRSSEGLGQ